MAVDLNLTSLLALTTVAEDGRLNKFKKSQHLQVPKSYPKFSVRVLCRWIFCQIQFVPIGDPLREKQKFTSCEKQTFYLSSFFEFEHLMKKSGGRRAMLLENWDQLTSKPKTDIPAPSKKYQLDPQGKVNWHPEMEPWGTQTGRSRYIFTVKIYIYR